MGKWETVRLGDVASFNMGQSPSSESYNSTGEGLPFFQGLDLLELEYKSLMQKCFNGEMF